MAPSLATMSARPRSTSKTRLMSVSFQPGSPSSRGFAASTETGGSGVSWGAVTVILGPPRVQKQPNPRLSRRAESTRPAGAEIPPIWRPAVQKYPRSAARRGRNAACLGPPGAFMEQFSPLWGGLCRVDAIARSAQSLASSPPAHTGVFAPAPNAPVLAAKTAAGMPHGVGFAGAFRASMDGQP